MGIKRYKPTSPGRRQASGSDFAEITRSRPEKSLTVGGRKSGGRNNKGRVTVWKRGGGHARRYRFIDFTKVGLPLLLLTYLVTLLLAPLIFPFDATP